MARINFLIKKDLQNSLFPKSMGFVSRVPETLFTLFLFAGTLVMNGNTPIFQENVSYPLASNLG